jgi:hypothetical protein
MLDIKLLLGRQRLVLLLTLLASGSWIARPFEGGMTALVT